MDNVMIFSGKLRCDIEGMLGRYSVEGIDRWVIYPIDDLIGFSRAIPMFCTVVAAFRGDQAVACVVLMPILKEVFMVEKGRGVFMEDVSGNVCRLRVSETAFLSKAMVGIDSIGGSFLEVPNKRFLGEGMINFVYFSSGRLDAFLIHSDLKDFAKIGELFATESGGKFLDFSKGLLFAGNSSLYESLSPILVEKMVEKNDNC